MSLITEGLNSGTFLMQGLGFDQQVITLAQAELGRRRNIRGRTNSDQRSDYEITIGSRILLINGIEPPQPLRGYVKVTFSGDKYPRVQIVESSSRKLERSIFIKVKKVTVDG